MPGPTISESDTAVCADSPEVAESNIGSRVGNVIYHRTPLAPGEGVSLANAVLDDHTLSLQATGLWAYLTSFQQHGAAMPPLTSLQDHGPNGRQSVQTALAELRARGLLVDRRSRTAQGRWQVDYVTVDEPGPVVERRAPASREDRHVRLALRDGWHCWYCLDELDGTPENPGSLVQVDHAEPRSQGGDNSLANYRLSCRHCNMVKGDRSEAWALERLRP